MDKEYLESLISFTDSKILKLQDIEELKNEYEQLRIRLINHLDLNLEDFRDLKENYKLNG